MSKAMDITFEYTKPRPTFGKQTLFCEDGPVMCDSIPTNPLEFKNYILRNPVHRDLQFTPDFSQHNINTIRAEYANAGINHSEGGWSKDINIHDPEAVQRYRRKIEKEDAYIHCVMNQSPGLEHYLLQNNAVDLYRSYYSEMPHLPEPEHNTCRVVNVFRDARMRPAASMNWQLDGHRFCVCYVDVDFYRVAKSRVTADIWDTNKPNHPETELESPVAIFDLKFNPRQKHMLVAGLATGQVAAFDARSGTTAVNTSAMHMAHRDIVKQVLFIQSKSGTEFFSSGPDGVCKWWDLRNLEEPTDEMIIDMVKTANDTQSMANACGVSVMEYEPTIPTRFMVGTENGLVVSGNRKGKTPLEQLPAKYEAHFGPLRALERNPFTPKNFLTVGDWSLKIWSEECRESPILWSPMLRYHVNNACWSPTRLSLILLAGNDGRMSIWDLLRCQHEPIVEVQLSKEPLLSLAMHEQGSFLTLGTRTGRVFLVELSHSLVETGKHDKSHMSHIFERETRRERILEARLREIRLKMRQAEEGSPHGSLSELDPSAGDKDLHDATAEYMAVLKKEITNMT